MDADENDLFEPQDDVLYFQISTAHSLLNEWGITMKELLALDAKYKLFKVLRAGYSWYHLTGIKGIALDLKRYMSDQLPT
jgi:hypothetical protein